MADHRNTAPPPRDADIWELIEFLWSRGLGRELLADGSFQPWTQASMADAFGGKPDERSIANWTARTNPPSPASIRHLSLLVSGGDQDLRRQWQEALTDARNQYNAAKKQKDTEGDKTHADVPQNPALNGARRAGLRFLWVAWLAIGLALGAGLGWLSGVLQPGPLVQNMRICDRPLFDTELKKCTRHVDVFAEGINEVYLSFDFEGVAQGAPFERWWIRNGERIAGRRSFNDEAWPGYTFWRPGVLVPGQYVVRLVVDEQVFTQVFYVQADGNISPL